MTRVWVSRDHLLINQNVNLCKRLNKLSEICPTSLTQLLTTKLPITVFFLLKWKKNMYFYN